MKVFCQSACAFLASVGSLTTTSSPANAQAAPSSVAAAVANPRSSDAPQAGEIVVTAQRRSELWRDVPISITSIGAKTLEQSDAQQLADIARITPALRFDSAGTFSQPTIRGVGTAITTSGGGPNVGIYVDGFFSSNPEVANFQLLNVENIQVLKGPQGTLFGRNTTGGAILVTTSEPSTKFAEQARLTYGGFNNLKAEDYTTIGLSDKIAMDFAGVYNRGDGYITNITTDDKHAGRFENWSIHTGIKAQLSDKTSVLVRYIHSSTNDPTGNLYNAYQDTSGQAGFFSMLTPAGQAFYGTNSSAGHALTYFYLPPSTYTTNPDQISTPEHTAFLNKSDAVQGTIKSDLGFAQLRSYTQWRLDRSVNVEPEDPDNAQLFTLLLNIRDTTVSQEFILGSNPGSRLQWTTGLNYFQYRDTYGYDGAFGGPTPIPFGGSSTVSRSYAAFADATYQATDKLFFTAGLRFSHDVVSDAYFLSTPGAASYTGIDGNLVSLTGIPALTRIAVPELTNNSTTPRAVIRYKPTHDSSIYASYTRGFKAGILNVGGTSLEPIKPETIDSFEGGFKYETHRFSFDLAAYYYLYRNLQISSFQQGQAEIRNAAQSRIYGAEASTRFQLLDRLNLSAGVAYTHARYQSFKNAPYYSYCDPTVAAGDARACTPPALGGFGPGGITQFTVDASGYHMQRAPDFTANVGSDYRLPVARGELTLSGNLYYTSSFYFDPSQQFRQGAYATLALRAQWQDPSRHYTIAVFGDNVTSERYRTSVLATTVGIDSTWNAATTWGVTLGAKF